MARQGRPRVDTTPVADTYTGPRERIVEFFDPNTGQGGLIGLQSTDLGFLRVNLYRLDERVRVFVSDERGNERRKKWGHADQATTGRAAT